MTGEAYHCLGCQDDFTSSRAAADHSSQTLHRIRVGARPERPTWDQILHRAVLDPVLHRTATRERIGDLTREECLIAAALVLSQQVEDLKNFKIAVLSRIPKSELEGWGIEV